MIGYLWRAAGSVMTAASVVSLPVPAVVGMAMLLRQPFLLLLIGFTCCMSSVSVILQRYYYKATRKIYGTPRRLFKMSPLHHHFEKCGMKETQIVLMYTVVTLVLTALAVISVIV